MESFRKVLEKYNLDKWFRKENFLVMVLAGILLVIISLPTKENEPKESMEIMYGSDVQTNRNEENNQDADGLKNIDDTTKYVERLEANLQEILSKVPAVGEVYVMVTLQESEEKIVEKDLIIKTIFPKVEGVAVVAQGAGNGSVAKTITEIIQVLFDIEMHKIKVVVG